MPSSNFRGRNMHHAHRAGRTEWSPVYEQNVVYLLYAYREATILLHAAMVFSPAFRQKYLGIHI